MLCKNLSTLKGGKREKKKPNWLLRHQSLAPRERGDQPRFQKAKLWSESDKSFGGAAIIISLSLSLSARPVSLFIDNIYRAARAAPAPVPLSLTAPSPSPLLLYIYTA